VCVCVCVCDLRGHHRIDGEGGAWADWVKCVTVMLIQCVTVVLIRCVAVMLIRCVAVVLIRCVAVVRLGVSGGCILEVGP
jgi:hypothetical protein